MNKRTILSEKNIAGYLNAKAVDGFIFEIKKVINVTEITKYSNAFFVYRAECLTNQGKKILYLKQSDGYVKRDRKIRINPARTVIEGRKLKFLESLIGKKIVPQVLHVDYHNYILVLDDIQGKKKILIEEFNRDKVQPQLAEEFGNFFGKMHGRTYNMPLLFSNISNQNKVNFIWRDWVMFGAKKLIKEEAIKKFVKNSDRAKKSFVWGDPVYRNIFVSKHGFSVLDFDFAMENDPALDNGIFLAHWLIKILEEKVAVSKDCRYFIKNFIKAYVKTMKSFGISAHEIKGVIKRTTVWTGIYMVSRTDGRSGSYYKNRPRLEAKIRETGLALITRSKNKTADWYASILTK
ncbi:MAG: phosphotransferase [Patescibacteria group bacterium]|jgi:tRNA A-37 threonylcarbamoyl transferase component Bud32